MKNITVIGAGTMGNGIAHVFAQSGFNVQLFDISKDALQRSVATIAKNMDRQIAKELLSESDKAAALDRLQTGTDLGTAVAAADLVVEAATENTAMAVLPTWVPIISTSDNGLWTLTTQGP